MEKKMLAQAIAIAKELNIPTLHQYESEAIKNLILENAHMREKEVLHLKYAYTEAIMSSRDARIRMQRDLAKLVDIEIWEPENLDDDLRELMQDLREAIEFCRQNETKYANARKELEELI